ncbi:hypothetical protein [Lysobacter brunescens]|uniref:Uncharacterized protein n=1 Tax=Lysobacter brunescens TaxID=262323 RepID=A0ABW2YG47_9GAMM
MLIIATTVVIALLAGFAIYSAYKAREQYINTQYSYDIREAILKDCDVLLDDKSASHNLKQYVSNIATMALSSKFLYEIANNPDLAAMASEHADTGRRKGKKTAYDALSKEEQDRVRSIMLKISLASMAYSNEYARNLRYMVDAGVADVILKQLHTALQSKHHEHEPVLTSIPSKKNPTENLSKLYQRVPYMEQLFHGQLQAA